MYDAILRRITPQLVFGIAALCFATLAGAQTQFTVTRDSDASGTCGAACSLRQALASANASSASGAVKIVFNIPGCGTHIINTSTTSLRATRRVIIDGGTQPRCSSTPTTASGIELRGPGDDVANPVVLHGLLLDTGSSGSQIRGLAINSYSGSGIVLKSSNNFVDDAKLGTDAAGTVRRSNNVGISIGSGTSGNDVGDSVISGNNAMGIDAHGNHSQIFGNMIGPAVDGTELANPSGPSGNGGDGIATTDAFDVQIGIAAAMGNTIAFNAGNGVHITGTSRENEIIGNKIHDNDGLGILLTGGAANDGQQAPTITSAKRSTKFVGTPLHAVTTTTVTGSIPGGSSDFSVELYGNDATCPTPAPPLPPSLGRNFEGQAPLKTDPTNANGTLVNSDGSFTVTTSAPAGSSITVIATSGSHDSSQFSLCVPITGTTL